MEKIKARINHLKEEIEACEERETDAKARCNEAIDRYDAAESEKNSFKRRLQCLQQEVEKTTKRLAEKQERLDTLETKTAADEEAVKSLENQEVEGDEKLESLASLLRRGQLEAEDYDTQWREAKRKKIVLERDIKKATSRLEESLMRIEELMESINNASTKIKALEARENDQTERETENEQKLAFLGEQEKEALVRAENAERDAARLERVIDGLEADRKNWKNKTAQVQAEIEDLHLMADDI